MKKRWPPCSVTSDLVFVFFSIYSHSARLLLVARVLHGPNADQHDRQLGHPERVRRGHVPGECYSFSFCQFALISNPE